MCEVCFDAVEDLAMPNRVIDSLRLPEEMDRRRKLTSAQKDDIKAKYVGGSRITTGLWICMLGCWITT